MARLRSRKQQVQESLTGRQEAAARFSTEEEPVAPVADSPLDELKQPSKSPRPRPKPTSKVAEEQPKEEESYTSRLLKAKRGAMSDKDKKKE